MSRGKRSCRGLAAASVAAGALLAGAVLAGGGLAPGVPTRIYTDPSAADAIRLLVADGRGRLVELPGPFGAAGRIDGDLSALIDAADHRFHSVRPGVLAIDFLDEDGSIGGSVEAPHATAPDPRPGGPTTGSTAQGNPTFGDCVQGAGGNCEVCFQVIDNDGDGPRPPEYHMWIICDGVVISHIYCEDMTDPSTCVDLEAPVVDSLQPSAMELRAF